MKKLKNKIIKIPIDLLDYTVIIVFTPDIQKYMDMKIKLFGKQDLSNYTAICINRLGESWCVLPNNSKSSLVCHEVSHAVDAVMENRGLYDGEVRSIIFEYIIRNIYE